MDDTVADLYKVKFTVCPGEGNRPLRNYLTGVKKLSVKALKKLKNHGTVLVNGKPALLKNTIYDGDRVLLVYPPEKGDPYMIPEYVPLNIVYEDKDVMVLDKQAGICVHPAKGHPQGTLANGVLYYSEKAGKRINPHFVNRLDMDTSGLVLLAKSTYGAQQFFRQQRERSIRRTYLALVMGEVYPESGVINLPIARADKFTVKREVCDKGQPSITHYKTIEKFSGYTLLEVQLETGRTHQIRVHLSQAGFPIFGDILYGGASNQLKRQFLHAYRLSFYHPICGELIEFVSQLPADLAEVLTNIRLKTLT